MGRKNAFDLRFYPCEGGYLFDSGRSGGTFVSEADYQALRSKFRRRNKVWLAIGIGAFAITGVCYVLVSLQAYLIAMMATFVAIIAYSFWSERAPDRLVRELQ